MTADEIRTPSERNRMVNYPYTKAQNANWDLDQGAALILCSAEAADAAGIARDRWVFPLAGSDANDTTLLAHRDTLHTSPAIRAAGRRTLALSGHGPGDFAHIDVYSCFPSAVQIAAAEIGLDESSLLTVTGGNTFAGGPANNYVTHSIATMVDLLRADGSGALGLVTANGGVLTKHAIGTYGTEPPPAGFRAESAQADVDGLPRREAAPADHAGSVTIEAYTVMHGQAGPEEALLALLTSDGRRGWGRSRDVGVMAELMAVDAVGRSARRVAAGDVALD